MFAFCLKFFFPGSIKHVFVFIFYYFCFVFINYCFLYCHYFISSPFPMLSSSLGLSWNLAFVPDSSSPPTQSFPGRPCPRTQSQGRSLASSSSLSPTPPLSAPARTSSASKHLYPMLPPHPRPPASAIRNWVPPSVSFCPLPRHHWDLKTLDSIFSDLLSLPAGLCYHFNRFPSRSSSPSPSLLLPD